ncbi:MAG: two-component sensor histidine kinase, partial [Oscillospiraceae bacterium]|nr:two-component sensor histidine kinase [Oscillospiraceae bacterium]
MTAKIFKSIFAASLSVLLIGMAIIIGVFYDYYGKLQTSELRDRFKLVSAAVESDGKEYLSKLNSDEYRFTLIAKYGSVIFDTQADAD